MFDREISEFIAEDDAVELVSQVLSESADFKQRKTALLSIVDCLASCDTDMREANADTFDEAILALAKRKKSKGNAGSSLRKINLAPRHHSSPKTKPPKL